MPVVPSITGARRLRCRPWNRSPGSEATIDRIGPAARSHAACSQLDRALIVESTMLPALAARHFPERDAADAGSRSVDQLPDRRRCFRAAVGRCSRCNPTTADARYRSFTAAAISRNQRDRAHDAAARRRLPARRHVDAAAAPRRTGVEGVAPSAGWATCRHGASRQAPPRPNAGPRQRRHPPQRAECGRSALERSRCHR